jgi:hypothetical protein
MSVGTVILLCAAEHAADEVNPLEFVAKANRALDSRTAIGRTATRTLASFKLHAALTILNKPKLGATTQVALLTIGKKTSPTQIVPLQLTKSTPLAALRIYTSLFLKKRCPCETSTGPVCRKKTGM